VKTAQSGEESIAMAAEEKPDVAVVDLRMPQMDSIETMDKLRSSVNLVILLTAMTARRI
jgi:two-component system OmpR family response regulator